MIGCIQMLFVGLIKFAMCMCRSKCIEQNMMYMEWLISRYIQNNIDKWMKSIVHGS